MIKELNTMKRTFKFKYPCSNKAYAGSYNYLTLPISDFEVDGIDHADYPDFCDAFINDCLVNGRPATDAELDQLNEDSDLVYECVENVLY